MDRLLSMEVFVAVVDAGSLTAAADLFQMSPPMVGKHLKDLESRLGLRLLSRTTRRQSLTEAGQQYYERCKFILAEIRAAEAGAEALRSAPRGHLRINASVSFGSLALAPAIADYLHRHPEVTVDLTLSDAVVDVVNDGYDIAIRIGELADSGLVARRLGDYRMMVCASPAYLERTGTPADPADLAGHQCLGFSHWSKRSGWQMYDPAAGNAAQPRHRFQSNNGQALRTAALAGFGIVMQPEVLLAEDVRAGRLVEILKGHWPKPKPIHLLYPRDRQAVPKLTTFVQFMVERFAGKKL